ncbi:hypothetical protein FALBO_9579 [Fusarium albosuccineum]|uniref:BTB domain-containing protein n=1 Tax=Fusarium albosuccineum TaxID=1237068 RepID=A0A8H4L7A5_9HYPO|nr:hypothetical protein FALBO_9579 [Fusarium albosuccineum]
MDVAEAEPGPSSDPSPPETIEFDPHGDLHLIVDTNPSQTMLVDSRALSRASAFFHSMFHGQFAESKPEEGDWVIKLPEDKAMPFKILMDMVHAMYAWTPTHLSIDNLFDLCVLTNKYDMSRALRPMADIWFYHRIKNINSLGTESLAKILFVAWELGHDESVRQMTVKIAREFSVDENGDFVDSEYNPLKDMAPFKLLPFMGEMLHYRASSLLVYRAECEEIGRKYFNKSLQCITWGFSADPGSCIDDLHSALKLGKLLRKAHELDLTFFFIPGSGEVEVLESLEELDEKLEQVRDCLGDSECESCSYRITRTVDTIQKLCSELPNPITADHIKMMNKQASKVQMPSTI